MTPMQIADATLLFGASAGFFGVALFLWWLDDLITRLLKARRALTRLLRFEKITAHHQPVMFR
jgi:hypothetical protein